MNFSERIEAVMRHYGLQSRELADKCGVQRTAINHLLNGRNRPSVGFLSALSTSFPELNTRWLLHGTGAMFTNVSEHGPSTLRTETRREETVVTGSLATENQWVDSKNDSSSDSVLNETNVDTFVTQPAKATKTDRRIVQVIVCYNDGTCSSYRYQE